ncbi:beta strand repeat-containing protein, partial [Psychromonas algarum]|uniref:beta strand repeat-containing protein n=1 Tax=Psychromonas algarum TaxID=2555643 RepID=UPI00403E4A3F
MLGNDESGMAVSNAGDLSSPYGTLHLAADGSYTFDLDNAHASALAAGKTATQEFTYEVTDVAGNTAHDILTITITGTNDVPVITGTTTGDLTEDATTPTLTVSDQLHITDADAGEAHFQAVTGAPSDHGYGEFTVTDNGHWTYTADNSQLAIQSLAEGQPLTDTITVLAADGTPTVLTVTITGTNDAPELTLTPDAAQPFTGTLTETDVDTTDTHTFTTTQGVGAFGTLTVDPATGDYVYTQTPGTVKGMAYDHNTGQYSGQDVFEVQVADNHGGTDIKYVTFDVSATMSGPTAANPHTPVVVHVGTPTAPTITQAAPTQPTITPPTNAVTIDLASTSDSFGQGTAGNENDNITSDITPTITGHVDIPFSVVEIKDGTTIVATTTADANGDYTVDTSALAGTDAGQVHHLQAVATAPGATGTPAVTSSTLDVTLDTGAMTVTDNIGATEDQAAAVTHGNVLGNDETGMTVSNAGDITGTHGTLHLNADGTYTYDLDNTDSAVQGLTAAGQPIQDVYEYHVTDAAGNTATEHLTITISGTDDAPVISGTDTGAAKEDVASQSTASGTLTITDVDAGEDHFTAASGITGTGNHGTLDIDASGAWTYHLDNANAEVQALGESATGTTNSLTDTFAVTSADGTAHTITVTIAGTNDAPAFTTATLTQAGDEDTTVSGQLGSTDTDTGDSVTYTATGTLPDGFTLHADGSYTLDASVPAYQHIAVGDTQDITIPVTVTDGAGETDAQTLTITLSGTNDAPVITDISAKTVAEGSTVTGTITSSDVDDHATATFSIAQPVDGFALNRDGSYTFDARHASYAHLAAGTSQDVSIAVTVTDEHGDVATQDLVIHITGTNDVPVIAGTDTGSVKEDVASQSTASGTLTITDVDAGENHFTAASGITGTGNHGTLDIDASGAWTYHLDNSNAEVQALGESATGTTNSLTDTFAVTSADGTAHTITVTIAGTNDAPAFTTATLTQAGDEDTTVSGQLGSTDTDTGDSVTYTATGTLPDGFTLHADGSYTLDASVPAYQHIAVGDTQDITIPVTVTDGAGETDAQTLTITLSGTNDAPVITDISAKTVAEGSTVTGTITSSDVDDHATATFSIAQPVDGFSLHADGSYTFDASHPAYAHLAAGTSQDVSIAVTVTDEHGDVATQDLVIHITGTNDVPVIAGTDTGSVKEDIASQSTASGTLSITDVDAGEDHFTAASGITGTGNHGSLDIDASGAWTYHLDNSNAEVQALGESATGTTN